MVLLGLATLHVNANICSNGLAGRRHAVGELEQSNGRAMGSLLADEAMGDDHFSEVFNGHCAVILAGK